MIFNRLLPIAALFVLALWLDAKRKSELSESKDETADPVSQPPPIPSDASEKKSVKTKTKTRASANVEVEPPADERAVSKTLQKAIGKLSPEQSKQFLLLMNTKPTKAMQEIPGVGASMADKIQAGRPYETPACLLDVSGIGENRLLDFLEWARGQ